MSLLSQPKHRGASEKSARQLGAKGRARQSAGRTARLNCRCSFPAGAVAGQHLQVFRLFTVIIIQLQAKHRLIWYAAKALTVLSLRQKSQIPESAALVWQQLQATAHSLVA